MIYVDSKYEFFDDSDVEHDFYLLTNLGGVIMALLAPGAIPVFPDYLFLSLR